MAQMNFIHPPDFKALSRDKRIEKGHAPHKAILALSQHTGAPSEPVVNIGNMVNIGTLIAKPKGLISSTLHSSISGKVIAIEDAPHPIIGTSKAIIVESDGKDEKSYVSQDKDITGLPREELITLIRDAGIVGLGGAAFPSHVKLSPPPDKKIDALIINGAECEPFLTCDYRLMVERPREIVLGIQIIAKILGVQNVIIGVEDNKIDAIESLGSALFGRRVKGEGWRVVKLRSRYPQGGEKQLIKVLLDREVPSGGLPFDVGVVVHNVQTVFAIYEAVYFKKPLYEKVISVVAPGFNVAKNIVARIGTPIKDILEYCGVNLAKVEPYKIIMGGPMTGVAQSNADTPIIKGTSGILVFDKKFRYDEEELECIRCGRCIEACPVSIMPCMIGTAVNKDRFDIAGTYDPFDCIECGSCGYVCPSKIPLVQLIKLAKTKIKQP